MKKTFTKLMILCLLVLPVGKTFSQVTIGSAIAPEQGALLDLKEKADRSSTKGLGLPRVELKDIRTETDLAKTMGATAGSYDADEHIGLIVYNVGKNENSLATRFCPGLYLWDGTKWQAVAPYTKPTETKTLQSSTPQGFTPLGDATDPMWATLGKNAGDYLLGYRGTFTDARDNEVYNYTRFYVGYTSSNDTYEIKTDLSCAQDGSKLITSTETIAGNPLFEDGIWMNDNLRAIVMPNGTAIQNSAANSNTNPQYYYPGNVNTPAQRATLGLLYNWAAAINMGPGAGQTPDPGGVDQGALNENAQIQGICPDGWYLPSDRQWTDLENGIIINTKQFANRTTDIGLANSLPYTTTSWRGLTTNGHGQAMKTTTVVNGTNPQGISKPAADGGFNGQLAGYAYGGSALSFGTYGYFWSSSSFAVNFAWYRRVLSTQADVFRNGNSRYHLFSVRCKKDN